LPGIHLPLINTGETYAFKNLTYSLMELEQEENIAKIGRLHYGYKVSSLIYRKTF
jgi:hypothetical protein